MTRVVNEYGTSGGRRIYQIPVQAFPGLDGWVYLALADGEGGPYQALIDVGSGLGDANAQIEAGLEEVARISGEPVSLENLTHIFITHAHIDHFGGLSYFRPRTPALLGVHELDRRILTNYEERLAVMVRRLGEFLVEAGVPADLRSHLMQMYQVTKVFYRSVRVDFTYEAAGMRVGPFEFLHVPGHCAGHVVIRLDDVLICGDQVLAHTSPHQAPEHLTLSTGLDHYLHSLAALKAWSAGARLALGGHEDPIEDLPARIDAITALHRRRLDRVREILALPGTVADVSQALFGEVHGYNVLLALEEAGAHVEYLYQRGLLGIQNLAELEGSDGPVALRYFRLDE